MIGVRPGLVVAVELKTATGRVSPEQREWLDLWGANGAVVRSERELLDRLAAWGVLG